MRSQLAAVAALALMCGACREQPPEVTADASPGTPDAHTDVDAPDLDAAIDAAGVDGAADAGVDAGADAAVDAAPDTPAPTCGDGHVDEGELCLDGAPVLQAGHAPDLVTGDFNGDGRADLLMRGYYDLTVLLRAPTGELVPLTSSGWGTSRPVAGDLDGDGDLDLTTYGYTEPQEGVPSVSILIHKINDGSGRFTDRMGHAEIGETYALGDLDGDGAADLVYSYYDDILVDGSRLHTTTRYQAPGLYKAQVVDVDGDGQRDIVGLAGAAIWIWRGLGDGTLAAPGTYPIGAVTRDFQIADVDTDGILDVVAVAGVKVRVLRGVGGGALGEAVVTDLPDGLAWKLVAMADLDGDHHLDALVIRRFEGQYGDPIENEGRVAYGRGDARFDLGHGLGAAPDHGVTFDVDLDGAPDIVGARANHLHVVAAGHDRQVATARNTRATFLSWDLGVGDVDGDGAPDLFTTGSNADAILVARPDGNGAIAPFDAITLARENRPMRVAAGDLDGDGDLDLATANDSYLGDWTFSIARNDGHGAFGATQLPLATTATPRDVAITDVDGDGDGDLVFAIAATRTLLILRNLGDGSFAAAESIALDHRPYRLVAGDVTGDGRPDLVVAAVPPDADVPAPNGAYGIDVGAILLLRATAGGTYSAPETIVVSGYLGEVVLHDLDGDGDRDLVATRPGPDTVDLLRNDGTGTFAALASIAVLGAESDPVGVVAADLNGDGHVDLATANYSSVSTTVLLGRGDGTFPTQRSFAVEYAPVAIVAADFDGDGHVDLVTRQRHTVSLLRGLAP